MKHYIGVDLGGTNIRAARFAAGTTGPSARAQQPTQAEAGPEAVIERILATIREVMPPEGEPVIGVGIGAPGPLNPFSGVILKAANLPGWKDVPLKRIVEEQLGVPTFLGNDANLACLAEWKHGAGRGFSDVLYMTVSTGIGGGIIAGGRMLLGAKGLAGEVGHTHALGEGPVCGCGQRGHLEAMANGAAIARTAAGLVRAGRESALREMCGGDWNRITTEMVAEAARAGDGLAREVLAEAGTYLGRGLASLMHILNPGIVVIGGGVAQSGDLLLEPIRAAIRQYSQSEEYWRDVPVTPAALGEDVGLLGAMALAVEHTKDEYTD